MERFDKNSADKISFENDKEIKVSPLMPIRDNTASKWQWSTISDAASGWAGWALARQEFGSSVNPIPIRSGLDFAHHITGCPPQFENLTASLHCQGYK